MQKLRILVSMVILAGIASLPAAAAPTAAEEHFLAIGDQINAHLEARGAEFRLGAIEWINARDEAGSTVFFNNRGNKQLAFDFVPFDPRRIDWSGPLGPGDDITWASDQVEGDAGGGIGTAATQTAITNAMGTWDAETCSVLPLTFVPTATDIGVLQWLLPALLTDGALPPGRFGGAEDPVADVTHGGFGTFVDIILPPPTIAATFTFQFIDMADNPTDIDNNGKIDAALREIYYTFNFPWAVDGGHIDVETVALHEAGHGISQAHFGKLFQTDANGKFHFAPQAVMNAGYTQVQRTLLGTDAGGHCSNWGGWPSN